MPTEPLVVIRCLGRFSVDLDGRRLDVDQLRPQARQVLQMLAVHGDGPVHREVLTDALWPDADPRRSFARLHTAVYDLRRFLEPAHELRRSTLLRHSGQTYRLVLPGGSHSDIAEFERAWTDARHALTTGRNGAAAVALRTAWAAYGGELLPEAGPVEWVQEWRGVLRQRALWVERTLAQLDAEI